MFTAHAFRFVLAIGLLTFLTACDQLPISFSDTPTPTLTATRAPSTPTVPPPLVAFPTALPTLTPAATMTLDARASLTAPVAQIVSPQNNSPLSVNQTAHVVVYAADDQGIARIELFADNVLIKTEHAPSISAQVFSAMIPWTPAQTGTSVLRALAYDLTNRASAADEITVNIVADARKPSATIVYPIGTPQIDLGDLVPIHAIATDEAGVIQIELWVDNQLYTHTLAANAPGQAQLATIFYWHALAPGSHTLIVRARDAHDQTTDSPSLKVLVGATRAPTLTLAFDRTTALPNEPITATITALDASGIARVELLNGKEIIAAIPSAFPAKQTALTAQIVWQNANPGDYQLSARAISAHNLAKDAPAQTITILRAGQTAPVAALATATRVRTPRATITPRTQPPPPPSAEIAQPANNFSSAQNVRAIFSGKGNAELERIELWGYTHGQPNPQVICSLDARAATQKTGQCDWSPPSAGVVYLYAQAIDIYRQIGKSPVIAGYIGAPTFATAGPTPAPLAGRWSGSVSNAQYALTPRVIGTAVRGELKVSTIESEGKIMSGSIRGDRITFHVDFAPATVTTPSAPITTTLTAPTANISAFDFDCGVDLIAGILNCAFKDSRGRSGSVILKRE
ncbi:MAG: Ig-like domain-containing protein [Chloroflexi bacterium]|nr:Ig-like domain-containing protein [Chloroflexota bacterium]